MRSLHDETLDTPIIEDGTVSFRGGVVSGIRSNLLDATQLTDALNMDITQTGDAKTRRGTIRIGDFLAANAEVTGLFFLRSTAGTELFAAADGAIYRWNGTAWVVVAGYAPAAGATVRVAQLVDNLYFVDGASNMFEWDGSTFTELEAPMTDPPPVMSMVKAFTNRLFGAGNPASPDSLYASDLLDGRTWDQTSWEIRVGADGAPITGILPWQSAFLVVAKKRGVYVVTVDPLATSAVQWVVGTVSLNVGCEAPDTMCQVGNDVWMLDRSGVVSVRRTASGLENEVSVPLSTAIQPLIDRINWDVSEKFSATFWRNRFLLAVALDMATAPDVVLVFNTITQTWSGMWTGWPVRSWSVRSVLGQERLIMGLANGFVAEWADWVPEEEEAVADFQDSGVDYSSFVMTKSFTFGDAFQPKTGNHLEVEFFKSQAIARILITRDSGSEETVANGVSTSRGILLLPFNLPADLPKITHLKRAWDLMRFEEFDEVQVKVETVAGKLRVRRIQMSAFVDAMRLER